MLCAYTCVLGAVQASTKFPTHSSSWVKFSSRTGKLPSPVASSAFVHRGCSPSQGVNDGALPKCHPGHRSLHLIVIPKSTPYRPFWLAKFYPCSGNGWLKCCASEVTPWGYEVPLCFCFRSVWIQEKVQRLLAAKVKVFEPILFCKHLLCLRKRRREHLNLWFLNVDRFAKAAKWTAIHYTSCSIFSCRQ